MQISFIPLIKKTTLMTENDFISKGYYILFGKNLISIVYFEVSYVLFLI